MAANLGVACCSTIVLRTKRCLSESSVGATVTTVGRSIARAGFRRRWPSSTAQWQKRRNAEKAVDRIRAAEAKGREDQALRDRVEQLERETEVLKEKLQQGEKKGGNTGG